MTETDFCAEFVLVMVLLVVMEGQLCRVWPRLAALASSLRASSREPESSVAAGWPTITSLPLRFLRRPAPLPSTSRACANKSWLARSKRRPVVVVVVVVTIV